MRSSERFEIGPQSQGRVPLADFSGTPPIEVQPGMYVFPREKRPLTPDLIEERVKMLAELEGHIPETLMRQIVRPAAGRLIQDYFRDLVSLASGR